LLQVVRRQGVGGLVELSKARAQRRRSSQLTNHWIERAKAQPGKRVLCTNLPRADLIKAYQCCDLFVFASIVEYSPLVLFEAAAAGKPFLSIPVGNAEEIARWTGGGIICPAPQDACGYTRADPSTFAAAMRRCMDEPDMLASRGATARERWRREFTWRAIAPRYEAILAGRADGEFQRKTAG
jgi:glycosyltransferase involved in cell wall biosynthesis